MAFVLFVVAQALYVASYDFATLIHKYPFPESIVLIFFLTLNIQSYEYME